MDGLGEEHISTFTQAVQRTFDLAMAKLPPALHGALERAHALVTGGHVWLGEDGRHAQVLSSDGQTWYVCNGHCTCMGVTHAPQGLCKHRLAVMLYRRASDLLASAACVTAAPRRAAPALPEAPASVNVRLCVGGHECQFTLRGTDEARLVERLEALLTRFPQAAKPQASAAASAPAQTPASAPGETPICATHGPMKASTKAPGTYFCSKKLFDGSYCQSRHPAQ